MNNDYCISLSTWAVSKLTNSSTVTSDIFENIRSSCWRAAQFLALLCCQGDWFSSLISQRSFSLAKTRSNWKWNLEVVREGVPGWNAWNSLSRWWAEITWNCGNNAPRKWLKCPSTYLSKKWARCGYHVELTKASDSNRHFRETIIATSEKLELTIIGTRSHFYSHPITGTYLPKIWFNKART